MSLKFSIRLPSPCPFLLPIGPKHLLCLCADGGESVNLSIVSLTLRRVTVTYPVDGQVLGLAMGRASEEEGGEPLILMSYRSSGLVQRLVLDDYEKPTRVEFVDFKVDCYCETFASPSLNHSTFLCSTPTDTSYTIYNLTTKNEATHIPSHFEGSKTGMLTSLRVMKRGEEFTTIALGFESGHLCLRRLDSSTFEVKGSTWHLPSAEEPILSLSSDCGESGLIVLAAGYAGEEPGFNVIVMRVEEYGGENDLNAEVVGKYMTSKSEIARPGVNVVKCFEGGVVSAGWDGRVRVFFHNGLGSGDGEVEAEERKDMILKGHKGSVRGVGVWEKGFMSSGEDGKLNFWEVGL